MELSVSRDDGVAILTLNRPDRLNAVSLPLYNALSEALREFHTDRAVRAIVLTGAGRAFCVGADLKAHAGGELSRGDQLRYISAGQRAHWRMQRNAKPIVAAVNGHAIGAGLELALSSDFVIIADDAKLRFPEIGLGTFVGGGTVYTLPARVGALRAKELLLLGAFFSPQDAVSYGIANRTAPADQVLSQALEVARALTKQAPRSVAHAKRLLNQAAAPDARRTLLREARALLDCMGTADWREGVNAFQEKRAPEFRGE